MKRLLLAVALVLAAGSARAVTLKELLAAADEQNVDVAIGVAQRERAAAEFGQAWSALLPSATVQGSWTRNQYPVEVQFGPGEPVVITREDQLDGMVGFEPPGLVEERGGRAAAAGAAADAAEQREGATRDAIRRQVATTYYGYAAALAVRESAKRTLGVSEEQLRLTQVRAQSGVATELDVLRARAEVERGKQTVADAETLVANTRRALRTLSGLEIDETAALPEDDVSSEGTLEELEAKVGALPAVRAAALDAAAAERLATGANLFLVPQVTANFTERFTNATGFSGNDRSYTAGLGLLWRLDVPAFYGMSALSSQRAAARLAAERQKLLSRDQVHNDWRRLQAAVEKVGAAQAQVEAAARAAKLARDRYELGAATQLDVIQSERDLFSAEVNRIQARTELASSHVAVRISAGLPLALD